MLQDRGRMDGYRNAILGNQQCFEGKTVLDVGTGSGVLAIWAGMAGARKVYAIEATSMAQHARRLVQQNGMQDVVTVLEGYMEKIELPDVVGKPIKNLSPLGKRSMSPSEMSETNEIHQQWLHEREMER